MVLELGAKNVILPFKNSNVSQCAKNASNHGQKYIWQGVKSVWGIRWIGATFRIISSFDEPEIYGETSCEVSQ